MPTRRRFLQAGLCAVLAGRYAWASAGSAARPDGSAAASGYIDLMPDFWAAYARAGHGPDRVRLLREHFFQPHADVYAAADLKVDAGRIARWLPDFDAMAEDVRRIVAGFPQLYAGHATRFRNAFPDFDRARAPIYLMPSLSSFDGHLSPWGARLPLFIGADGLVRYHGATPDLAVFLDHESFHLYQSQIAPEAMMNPSPPVYASLWIEGVATYVSERLNPAAALLHVLLDDTRLADADAATKRAIAAAMLDALDSTSDEDASRFFSAGAKGPLPARGGYLVGLEVARRIGRDMPLAQLPRLQGAPLRQRVARELAALAASSG